MAFNPVPDDVYPSSTAAGLAIPLDVARPVGFYRFFESSAVELPEDINLVSFFSSVNCTVGVAGAVEVNGYMPESFYALANVNYELILPKSIQVLLEAEEDEDKVVIINLLQKWQQMDNLGKYYSS